MPLRPLACLSAFLAAVVFATLFETREALATRDYAKAEGKECAFCHVSDKGSGPRNPKGQEYEANGHRFGVKSWTSDENRLKFLRASSAIVAQWYAEATKLLDELAKQETLPGGVALVEGTRARFKMFKGPWLRNAKKLLALGDRGLPNGLMFLTKVESQFGGSDEGREAASLLDAMAKDAKTKDAVADARATERARLFLLEGVTEFQLGNRDAAKALFDKALADPHAKAFERELREAVAALSPSK